MARKIKVDMTGVEAYGKVGEGIHPAKIVEAEQGTSQAGDDMITVAYEVTAGPDKGGRVYDNFVLTQKALWKLKVMLKAIGMKCDGRLVIDLDRLIGKACDIEVFHDEYNGQKRAKISDYYKLGTHSNAGNTEDEDLDDIDEEVEDEEPEEKPAPKKATRTKKKAEPELEPEEEEDSDEWDDDEEEEEPEEKPAPKKRGRPAKKAPAKRKKPEPEPEEDDDEDEWEEDDE